MSRPGLKGYCKLCSSKYLADINRQLDEGWNSREIISWVSEASKGALTFNRQTLYAHRDNVNGTHKRAAAAAPVSPSTPPTTEPPGDPGSPAPKSSNDEFLEFIRDHSMAELKENPSLITPRMGMEAVKILEARKQGVTNVLVLARVLTNQIEAPASTPNEIVVGEYRELPAPPTSDEGIVEHAEGAKVQ
jgi:hypothetical protein